MRSCDRYVGLMWVEASMRYRRVTPICSEYKISLKLAGRNRWVLMFPVVLQKAIDTSEERQSTDPLRKEWCSERSSLCLLLPPSALKCGHGQKDGYVRYRGACLGLYNAFVMF